MALPLTSDGPVHFGLVLDDVPGGGQKEESADHLHHHRDEQRVLQRREIHFRRVRIDGRAVAVERRRSGRRLGQ